MVANVVVPNTFVAASDAIAAEVNANFVALRDHINNYMVSNDGVVAIAGTQTLNNVTVTGDLTLTGNLVANATIKGDVVDTGGSTVILDNTAGAAWFRGDVKDASGTVIVDVSAATFAGNATTATTATTTSGNAATATLATTATNLLSGTSKPGNGSAGAPGHSFSGDATTGMYLVTTDQVGFSTNGTLRGRFWAGGLLMGSSALDGAAQIRVEVGTAALPNYTFYNDRDTGMYRSSANVLGFSTAGALRLHIDSAGALLHQSGVDNAIFYTGNIACNYASGAEATIHHYNRRAWGNEYGLKMYAAGDTDVNCAWGRTLWFKTDAYIRASIQNDGFRLNSFPVISGWNSVRRRTSDFLCGYDGSSLRYKDNVVDADETWRSVYNLRPVDFDWNNEIHSDDDGERHDYGLIAEETAITMPSVVTSRVVEGQGDLPVPDGIQYEKLSVYLIPLVQDLNARLEALEAV